jgi:hypothetical protein
VRNMVVSRVQGYPAHRRDHFDPSAISSELFEESNEVRTAVTVEPSPTSRREEMAAYGAKASSGGPPASVRCSILNGRSLSLSRSAEFAPFRP